MKNEKTIEQMTEETKARLETVFKAILNIGISLLEEKEDDNEMLLTESVQGNFALFISIQNEKVLYYPQKVMHNPGVRYYKDGSGEPPSEDFIDLLPDGTDNLDYAIHTLLNYIIDIEFKELQMREAEEREFERFKEEE